MNAMIQRRRVLLLSAEFVYGASAIDAGGQGRQREASQEHTAWVAQTLKRMETIKPGMKRQDLLRVFTTEGGLSTGLRRTFVSQDCPYFKVDVEFQAVGRPNRDDEGRATLVEDDRDIILKISRPYLQFTIAD